MSFVTGVKTEQHLVYDVVATDHEHKILSTRKNHVDAPFYFIRLIDMYRALSAEQLPKKAEIVVYRQCPIYIRTDHDTFEQVKSLEDHCSGSLYLRYDRCFHIMHAWLGQVIAWRKETGRTLPSWIADLSMT